jgi:septal ring factor EnvC (AmiA/AmiB activator)
MGKDVTMRLLAGVMAVMLAFSGVVYDADTPTPDQLKKMYDEALAQLKNAQDRKNELAKENEDLKAKAEEMGKDLAAAQAQVQDLKRDLADNDEKDFYLRAYHAAWENFIARSPELMARWKAFIGSDAAATAPSTEPLIDPHWPAIEEDPGDRPQGD